MVSVEKKTGKHNIVNFTHKMLRSLPIFTIFNSLDYLFGKYLLELAFVQISTTYLLQDTSSVSQVGYLSIERRVN